MKMANSALIFFLTGPTTSKLPSVTMASNSSSVMEYLQHVKDRSKVKFEAGAYLHWYQRYGASEVGSTPQFSTELI